MAIYPILSAIFFLTVLSALAGIILFVFRPRFWIQQKRILVKIYGAWLVAYAVFVMFGTGPTDMSLYPPSDNSPYKLPWKNGVSRFVSQGNRSFTSHRDLHFYAWDFWMPIGTEILASRSGKVIEIEDQFDGIGLKSNYVKIQHDDRTRSLYAHIRHGGSVVKVGDSVQQGQLIAYSGMVGQTLNPHLHFVVFNEAETKSIPISFSEVSTGVPLAGRFYTSKNPGN